jgi:hypothetical protein
MCAYQTTCRAPIDHPRCASATGRCGWQKRGGLAPLEMILGLPLILLLFALIFNAGFTGMWKLRMLGASQEAAWRDRGSIHENRQNNPKNGASHAYITPLPPPKYQSDFWRQREQAEETNTHTEVNSIADLNLPGHEIKRELSSAPAVRTTYGAFQTVTDLLDPTKSTVQGTASISRYFPLLQNSLPMLNDSTHQQFTHNSFPYWNMESSTHQDTSRVNLGNNVSRRTKVLFEIHDLTLTVPPVDDQKCPDQNQLGNLNQLSPEEKIPLRRIHGTESFRNIDFPESVQRVRNALRPTLHPLTGFDEQGGHGCDCEDDRFMDGEAYDWAGVIAQLTGKGSRCQPFHPPKFMPPLPSFLADAVVGQGDSKYVTEKYGEPHMVRVEDEPDKLINETDPHDQQEDEFYPQRGSLPHTLAGSYIDFFQRVIKEHEKYGYDAPPLLINKKQSLGGYQPEF